MRQAVVVGSGEGGGENMCVAASSQGITGPFIFMT
jgi:hypothetical protein